MIKLRPDNELWSTSFKLVYIIEFTVTGEDAVGEDAVEETCESKKLKYVEFTADRRSDRPKQAAADLYQSTSRFFRE